MSLNFEWLPQVVRWHRNYGWANCPQTLTFVQIPKPTKQMVVCSPLFNMVVNWRLWYWTEMNSQTLCILDCAEPPQRTWWTSKERTEPSMYGNPLKKKQNQMEQMSIQACRFKLPTCTTLCKPHFASCLILHTLAERVQHEIICNYVWTDCTAQPQGKTHGARPFRCCGSLGTQRLQIIHACT